MGRQRQFLEPHGAILGEFHQGHGFGVLRLLDRVGEEGAAVADAATRQGLWPMQMAECHVSKPVKRLANTCPVPPTESERSLSGLSGAAGHEGMRHQQLRPRLGTEAEQRRAQRREPLVVVRHAS